MNFNCHFFSDINHLTLIAYAGSFKQLAGAIENLKYLNFLDLIADFRTFRKRILKTYCAFPISFSHFTLF